MNRRDFLKAISTFLPAAVITRMDLTDEVEAVSVEPEVVQPTEKFEEWMQFSEYFAGGTSNRIYRMNGMEPNVWHIVDMDEHG